MCAAGGAAPKQATTNYGASSAGQASAISQEERQWYIDNGFGDPNAVVGQMNPVNSPRFSSGGSPGSYKGVSAEARYLYNQRQPANVAPVAAPVAAPVGGTSGMAATPPTMTRWAGKALTINPASM